MNKYIDCTFCIIHLLFLVWLLIMLQLIDIALEFLKEAENTNTYDIFHYMEYILLKIPNHILQLNLILQDTTSSKSKKFTYAKAHVN